MLGRREEPDIGKQTSGTSCEWEGWRHGSMRLLDRSWQTSPRTWSDTRPVWVWSSWTSVWRLSGSIDANLEWDATLHPSLELWGTGWTMNPDSRLWGGTTSMVSFLKRVSTSCPNIRACPGSTRVETTLLNWGGGEPNWILQPHSTVCRTHRDTFGSSFHADK